MFRFYSIFVHLYLIINDLYAIVFHYYSMTSIYIPNFSFVFYVNIYLYCIIMIYIRYFHICIQSLFISILYFSFVFYLFIFLLYNCLFTFNNLHLYSIFVRYYSISVYLYSMFYIFIQ